MQAIPRGQSRDNRVAGKWWTDKVKARGKVTKDRGAYKFTFLPAESKGGK